MISEKDLKYKTAVFLTSSDTKNLTVRNGELLITDKDGKTRTKLAFPKIAYIFAVGTCTLTTPVLEKLAQYAVPFCLMKQSLRPVLWKADMAEANYLLRKKQYEYKKEDISIAKYLIRNKIINQTRLIQRLHNSEEEVARLEECLYRLSAASELEILMITEAKAASVFFKKYYENINWCQRKPRIKCDELNTALDIGYTILFNFIEANLRLFGFDLYKGVLHQEWFRRKSLVCDIMEPFRCIIDKVTLLNFKEKIFYKKDFIIEQKKYNINKKKTSIYYSQYAAAIMDYKMEIFKYIRDYYRYFMQTRHKTDFPEFII